jgi:hypothetical protein
VARIYVSRPRAHYLPPLADYPFNTRKSIDVHEYDDARRDTGLVDARGRGIFAVTEREPIGFIPTRETDG